MENFLSYVNSFDLGVSFSDGLSTTVKPLFHHISLTKEARADMQWWIDFLPSWNRRSIIPGPIFIYSTGLQLFTDASSIGFGAIYKNTWIQGQWNDTQKLMSIDFKEMFAIVAAALVWGTNWKGKSITFITDNLPIMELWRSGSTPSAPIMALVRNLCLIAARLEFSVSLKHISGANNPIAVRLFISFSDAEILTTRTICRPTSYRPPNRSMEPHESINVMLPSVNELTNAMQQIMSSTLAGSTQLNYKFQTVYQLLSFTEHVCIATTRI